jgi:hypothetical protein
MYSSETGLWSDLSHTVPFGLAPRFGHTATLHDKRMLLCGGRDGHHVLRDVWECDLVHLLWIRSSHVWSGGEEDEDGSPTATRAAPNPRSGAALRGSSKLRPRPAVASGLPTSGLPPWWAQLPGSTVVDAIAAVQAAARRRALRIRFGRLIKEARRQGEAAARIQAGARGWAARLSPSKKVWY